MVLTSGWLYERVALASGPVFRVRRPTYRPNVPCVTTNSVHRDATQSLHLREVAPRRSRMHPITPYAIERETLERLPNGRLPNGRLKEHACSTNVQHRYRDDLVRGAAGRRFGARRHAGSRRGTPRRRGRARDQRTDRCRPARPAGRGPRLRQPAAGREAPSTDRRRGRGRTVVARRSRPRRSVPNAARPNASRDRYFAAATALLADVERCIAGRLDVPMPTEVRRAS